MFLLKNKKTFIVFIIFFVLTILFISAYFYCKRVIKKYKIPFMELKIDFSRKGEYAAILNKTFNPDLAIALCVVPENVQRLPPTIFQGLDVILDITGNEFAYRSNCAFTRAYRTQSGMEYYCMYLPPKKFPPGKYRCALTVVKPIEQFKTVPISIIVYPVYDFYPMIAMFLLFGFYINAVITTIMFILLSIKRHKNQQQT